jgi:hypothetical protein
LHRRRFGHSTVPLPRAILRVDATCTRRIDLGIAHVTLLLDTPSQIVSRRLLQIRPAVAVIRSWPIAAEAIRLSLAAYCAAEHVVRAETGDHETGLRAGFLEGKGREGVDVLGYGADLGVREL